MSHGTLAEGILPVDKPVGPSSHDIVALARKHLGIRRVGHTGTLDPLASGLLLTCLGRSTRLAQYVHLLAKEYTACARLGATTVTDDPEGPITSRSDRWKPLTLADVSDALETFIGPIQQRPPDFSAKKVRGTAAYELARRGKHVALAPVEVIIHAIDVEAFDPPNVRFRVKCSTGTYIRSLARDLGEHLGVGAHLTELRRLSIGPFHVRDALAPDALCDASAVEQAIISPVEAVAHLPRLEVSRAEAMRLQSGQSLLLEIEATPADEGEHAVVFGTHLLAVAVREGREVRPKKVFSLE